MIVKNRFRIGILLAITFFFAFILFGCGSPGAGKADSATDKKENNTQSSNSQDNRKITLRLGSAQPAEGPYTAVVKEFAEIVKEKTNGNLIIQVYPAQQLGSDRELIEMTQSGALDVCEVSTANFMNFDKALGIVDLPYLFPTPEIAYKVLFNGEVGRELLDTLDSANLKGIVFLEGGFKQMTTNFPVSKPEDFKGKKIRVQPNQIQMAAYSSLGATPTPINYSELYTALQEGVVDGQDNPMGGIYDSKLYEVQKYLTLSDHSLLTMIIAFNKGVFDSLPSDYQQVVYEAGKKAMVSLRDILQQKEMNEWLPVMEKAGMKVTKLTPEQRKAFKDKALPESRKALVEKNLDEPGKKLLEKLESAIENEVKQQ